MPSSTARRLCPDAIWTHGRFDRYREVSNAIMGILRDETPHVQQVSIDEAFLDVTPHGGEPRASGGRGAAHPAARGGAGG